MKRIHPEALAHAEPVPQGGSRVLLARNPRAGARSSEARVALLVERLAASGLSAHVETDLSTIEQRAAELHAAGELRALVGVGGDGTAAELVNRTPPGLPLAILPSGNENLLARYLGWSKDPHVLADSLIAGRMVRLDAASANGRIFLIMVGCGFDAEVVHRVHARRTGHIRSSHYVKPIAEVVRNYQYPLLSGEIEPEAALEAGSQRRVAGRWLFVFNFPCYGGNLPIAPDADPTDGLLDVISLRRGSLYRGLRYAAGLYLRLHRWMRDRGHDRAERVVITAPEGESVAYQLDGDPGGVLPVTVCALPGRLTAILPAVDGSERGPGRGRHIVRSEE